MALRRRKKIRNRKFNAKMQADLLLVFCVVIALFVVLIGRVWYIDQKDGERYEKRVLSQQTYMSNPIPYKRGSIVDRNNTILAKSEKIYNLVLDPKAMLDKEEYKEPTIQALTTIFEITAAEIETKLSEKPESRYEVMIKGLSHDPVEAFEALETKDKNIQGVWFETDYKRVYPLKSVACDVVGFTNSRGEAGIGGIEGYYNSSLTGNEGREYGYFDADLKLERTVKPAQDGNTIVTTLDANVQAIVEKHIAKFNKESGSKNTAVVVMNPKNGEIYAMASGESYDLNNPWDLSSFFSEKEIKNMSEEDKTEFLNQLWRNFCISDAYEPGSTFKPVTVSAALEEAKAKEGSSYVCDGKELVLGVPIACNARGGHGTINLKQTLMMSCNDAMMHISRELGKTQFHKYQKLFNFGSKTGVDLPGETSGDIFSVDRLNPIELATSSFGQGFTVNMLQLSSAVASVINGGYYYEPHVVKSIQNSSGATVDAKEPVLVRETVSSATSELIRNFLYETVENGTGKKAQVPGYEIGGKTGTAQKWPRADKKYLVSFIGFTPIDDPKVLVYVIVDEPVVPKGGRHDDSSYAQYLSRDIMAEILPFLGVFPEETADSKTDDKKKEADAKKKDTNKKAKEETDTKKKGELLKTTPEPDEEDEKEEEDFGIIGGSGGTIAGGEGNSGVDQGEDNPLDDNTSQDEE